MAKYIDAEKLKESLKRHYTDITVPVITSEGGLESYFRRSEIIDTIKLIDSLQQEQPEDLEKEIEKYYYDNFAFISSAHTPTMDIVSDIANHFYELGLNARKED